MSVSITFLGGAGTVTGSKYLVRHNNHSLLLDCGLFQGYKLLRLRNWQPLPVTPHQIDSVVLTHAHLDHSGYLPLLARDGYTKDVHCTPGTRDLCAILLPDSGHLQEEDAAYLNRHALSKHQPALPLYTRLDALHSLKQLRPHPFGKAFEPIPGWRVQFSHAGHILGAASVLRYQSFDLVVLDIGLPRLDGLRVLAGMRERGDSTPVLMLTARDGIEDRVQALDVGADDYLGKPFNPRELLARIRSVLRRAQNPGPAANPAAAGGAARGARHRRSAGRQPPIPVGAGAGLRHQDRPAVAPGGLHRAGAVPGVLAELRCQQ